MATKRVLERLTAHLEPAASPARRSRARARKSKERSEK
jgi:hypothetical protein